MASGSDANPAPIDGGWCPVTCPAPGSAGPTVVYLSCCEVPLRRLLGGNIASLLIQPAVEQGSYPAGHVRPVKSAFRPAGAAAQNHLDCSSIPNSSPDPSCTKCACNNGTYWDPMNKSCDYCTSTGGQCTTSNDGATCSVVTCPPNMNCNTSLNACQCNSGTIYQGPVAGCSYCAAACMTSTDGVNCVPIDCSSVPNSSCNPALLPSDPNYDTCECWKDYCWNGTACVYYAPGFTGICPTCTPNCNTSSCTNACTGTSCTDSCGGNTCTGAKSCGSTCVPGPCQVLSQCGSSLGTDLCGVCTGAINQCPNISGSIGVCDYNDLKCVCDACRPVYQCGEYTRY